MRIFLLVFSLICSASVWSGERTYLFREFYSGQTKEEIMRMKDVTFDRGDSSVLYRKGLSFAGFNGWIQSFLFDNKQKLYAVGMINNSNVQLRTNVKAFIVDWGFFPCQITAYLHGELKEDFSVTQYLSMHGPEATTKKTDSIIKMYSRENGLIIHSYIPVKNIKENLNAFFTESTPLVAVFWDENTSVLFSTTGNMRHNQAE